MGYFSGTGDAAVSGAFGLIGSLISGHQQKKENARNRKWQRQMYDLSVQNNREDATTAFERQKELAQQQAKMSLENEQTIERNHFQNLTSSAKEAGVNMGLALNGGMGGNSAGGVATPNVQESSPGSTPSASAMPIPPVQMALDLSTARLNKALAKKAEEEGVEAKERAETERETREGKTGLLDAQYQEAMQRINESRGRIARWGELNLLTKAQTNWQDLQNEIGNATKDVEIQKVKQALDNLKMEYKELKSKVNLNNASTADLRIKQRYMNQYWGAIVTNVTNQGLLLAEQTNNETWKALMNSIAYDIADATKAWDIKKAKAIADKAENWKEMFEAELNMHKRGQNMQLIGMLGSSVIDLIGDVAMPKPSFGAKKTIKYDWNGKGFTPKTSTKTWFE